MERTVEDSQETASGNGTHRTPGHQSRRDMLRNRTGLGQMLMTIVASGRDGDASLIDGQV